MTIPRVEIEEFQLGELRWRVRIHRPDLITLWERYATQAEAIKGKAKAEAYLREQEAINIAGVTIIDLIHAAGFTVEPWNDAVGDHFQVVKDDQRITTEAFQTKVDAYTYAAGWLIPSEQDL